MKVSFDFDDTLCHSYTNGSPVHRMVAKLIDHHEAGDEIYIVTTRMDVDMPEVRNFVAKHHLPLDDAHIVNTNFSWKRNTLKRLNIDVHYDDNPDELHRLGYTKVKGINVLHYLHSHP